MQVLGLSWGVSYQGGIWKALPALSGPAPSSSVGNPADHPGRTS